MKSRATSEFARNWRNVALWGGWSGENYQLFNRATAPLATVFWSASEGTFYALDPVNYSCRTLISRNKVQSRRSLVI